MGASAWVAHKQAPAERQVDTVAWARRRAGGGLMHTLQDEQRMASRLAKRLRAAFSRACGACAPQTRARSSCSVCIYKSIAKHCHHAPGHTRRWHVAPVQDATTSIAAARRSSARSRSPSHRSILDPQGTQELDDGSRLDAAGLGANRIGYLSEKEVVAPPRAPVPPPPAPPPP